MPTIRIDATRLSNLDISAAKSIQIPAARRPGFGEDTALRASLSAYAATHRPGTGVIRDMLRLKDASYLSAVVVGSIPKVKMPSISDLTLTYGPFVSGTLGFMHSGAGGGVYFWWSPKEFGLYGGGSFGLAANVLGFGGGLQVCILFGPAPVYLAGASYILGVDVTAPGLPAFAGGFLVFGPSWDFRGVGWDVGVGEGAVPVEISLSISGTATRAVGHI